MTDTDKLKRLAEGVLSGWSGSKVIYSSEANAILALIAENEALEEDVGKNWDIAVSAIAQRDEAVALLRPLSNMATVCGKGGDDSVYVGQSGIRLTFGDFRRAFAFLARIDAKETK